MAAEAFVTHRGAQAPASDWEVKGLRGFEFEIRGGFALPESASPITAPTLFPGSPSGSGNPTGDILSGNIQPYSYDPFAPGLAVGYRIWPFLSVGMFFDYEDLQINGGCDAGLTSCSDNTSQLERRMWQWGAYGRYYLTTLSDRLHPWAELDLGFAAEDTTSYTRGLGAGSPVVATNYYLTYWGWPVALRVGLDWRLAPWLAVGPFAGYTRVIPISGNVEVCPQTATQTGDCDTTQQYYKNTSSSPPVETTGYGMFFGGIFAKVTLGPSLRQ